MGTLDAPDNSRGVSFQLAIGTASCAKAASWKLTPLSNATFVGRVTLARHPFACGFVATVAGALTTNWPKVTRRVSEGTCRKSGGGQSLAHVSGYHLSPRWANV